MLNYRTTTPNSLREALKETLRTNIRNNDIAETIQHFTDGEILDTFNAESGVNSQVQQHTHNNPEDRSDTMSLPGERAMRRKPLGDRELMLKKNKLTTQDMLGSNEPIHHETEEELGNGLFDRFSLARKTLDRTSIR